MRTIIYIVSNPEFGDVDVFVNKAEAIEQAEFNGVDIINVCEVTENSASYIVTLERDSEWEEIEE